MMDTRVLLANTAKKFEAIFNGLGVLSQMLGQNKAAYDEVSEVTFMKLIELDNKLDAIMAHSGVVYIPTVPTETLIPEENDPVLLGGEAAPGESLSTTSPGSTTDSVPSM